MADTAVGELGVKGARAVRDEVVGRVLPQHQDVHARELGALLHHVHLVRVRVKGRGRARVRSGLGLGLGQG